MKREIKFRYWNGVTQKMVNDPEMPYKEGWKVSDLFSDRGWVWMQFTGLLDRNGKEIYEGDVVSNGEEYGRRKVKWAQEDAGWFPFSVCSDPNIGWECGAIIDADECEVIGNIYENPELLL